MMMRLWRSQITPKLPYLTLLPFALGALFLAFVIFRTSEVWGIATAILPAWVLVGWLALGGMAMNFVRGQRKPKPHESIKAKRSMLDPNATFALADDGELIEVVNRNSKQGSDRA
jgi:hypothetical protein